MCSHSGMLCWRGCRDSGAVLMKMTAATPRPHILPVSLPFIPVSTPSNQLEKAHPAPHIMNREAERQQRFCLWAGPCLRTLGEPRNAVLRGEGGRWRHQLRIGCSGVHFSGITCAPSLHIRQEGEGGFERGLVSLLSLHVTPWSQLKKSLALGAKVCVSPGTPGVGALDSG